MVFAFVIGRFLSLPFVVLRYIVARSTRVDGEQVVLDQPRRLRFILETLGGAFLKFGELLAMRFDLLPLPYAVQLLNIRDRTPERPSAELFDVFKKDSGKDVREAFESVEEKALTVSVFYQSYRARFSGRDVVVKIQRPRVREQMRADVIVLRFLAGFCEAIGVFHYVSLFGIIRQLEEWLSDELDYTVEASNNAALYEHAGRHPSVDVVVPQIYPDFARQRVLVREYLPGIKVDKTIAGLAAHPEETNRALASNGVNLADLSGRLIRDMMRQYFVDGFFYLNPYPSILLLMPEGRFSYTDFGIIGQAAYSREPFLLFFKAALNLETYDAASSLVDFSRLATRKPFTGLLEEDERARSIFDQLLEHMKERIAADITPALNRWRPTGQANANESPSERSRRTATALLDILAALHRYKLTLPPDAIAFLRALLMLDLIGQKLDPKGDLGEIIRAFIDHPPVPIESAIRAHEESTMPLNEFDRLRSIDVSPEEAGEASVRSRERIGSERELFDAWVSALVNRYPELYNEIKYL